MGHQLYVLKMTVSNKCLLPFFQGLCVAEFVVIQGVGSFPRADETPTLSLGMPCRKALWDL